MAASSWAEALICWVEAFVSSVEADTCSVAADDSLGDARDLGVAVAICSMRSVMSSTAAPISPNAPGLGHDRRALLGAAGAVGDDGDGALGLDLDLADQARDLLGGPLRLLGQLAHLLGDDGEPAALLAGAGGLDGRVQRQQVRLPGDAR